MPRSIRTATALVASGILLGTTFMLAGPSSAQAPAIGFAPVGGSLFQPTELQVEATLTSSCDDPLTASQIDFEFDGAPTTAVTATVDGSANQFLVTVPQTLATDPSTPNLVDVAVSCDVGGSLVTQVATLGWAQINVTKTVVGDGPAGGYRIVIDCEQVVSGASVGGAAIAGSPAESIFDIDLEDGETFPVFALTNGVCTIEETDSLGATSSVVSPPEVTIAASALYPVTITNTFPEAPTTTTTVPAGEPATPRFTG